MRGRIVATLALVVALVATAFAQPGGNVITPSSNPRNPTPDTVCLDAANQDTCWRRAAARTFGLNTDAGGNTELRVHSSTAGEYVAIQGINAGGLAVRSNSNVLNVIGAGSLQLGGGGLVQWTISSAGVLSGPLYASATRCANTGSPAVCAAAPAGSVVIAAAATSVVVNTTAVTANSQVFAMIDRSLGALLSVTCDTTSDLTTGSPAITARTAATSFTIAVPVAPAANPMCLSYFIIN